MQPTQRRRPGPTNPFVEFRPEEIEQSLPARFVQQVQRRPQHVAVKTDRHELTYDALNRAANRLAHAILARCGPDSAPVGFLLDHGTPSIVAILGILKAGKAYLPLDPSLPPARLARMREHAQVELLLTDTAHLSLAEELSRKTCPVLDVEALAPDADANDPDLKLAPDRSAYILYTSGSTGEPKGVVQNHRNILHLVQRLTNPLHICPDDRVTLLASCSFAASVSDIFQALLNGATLLPYALKGQDFQTLVSWLIDEKVTVYHSSPSAFRHFVGTLTGVEKFPCLRLIRLGGEPVHQRDVALLRKHFSADCLLAVTYAATETGVIRLSFPDAEQSLRDERVALGHALEDMEIALRGEDGAAVGPGQVGEIFVRSAYLAVGYWREPERTAAAFQPDPERPGVRIYRTGDLGLLRPDGSLEHLGRKDDQVKVRGHRVEVAEVEAALLALGDIKAAAVVGQEDRWGGRRLVAYIVPVGVVPTAGALREALHVHLPDYLIPSAYVALKALPLTPTGKVDRRALPAPDTSRPALGIAHVPPQNRLQAVLVRIWEECLNVHPVGIHDDFFALGGDSLLAIEMLTRVGLHYGVKLNPTVLFNGATVQHLNGVLMNLTVSGPLPPLTRVQEGTGRPFFFLHADWHGGGLFCVQLARRIGSDQTFYAVHPHGLTSALIPPTVEAIAADRVAAILAVEPQGPYMVGGYCSGGVIAFEIARQLRQRGHQVDLTVMLSPPRSLYLAVSRPRDPSLDSEESYQSPPPYDVRGLPPEKMVPTLNDIYRVIIVTYSLQPSPGRLVVLVPHQDGAAHCSLPLLRAVAEEVEIRYLPGGHFDILTQHLPGLAEHLKVCLRQPAAALSQHSP